MIEEVKQIFDDIRDAIIEMGGDIDVCSSPEEYAEAIKELTGNTAVLFIPCFKSSELKPTTPTKTMSPADPTDYPEGWGTPDGLTGKIWMTYTMVSTSTVYVPWTEPVLLGEAGSGPQPSTFDDATTRTFLIFLELPSLNITPTRPVGGNWDTQNNILYNNPTFTFNGITYTWASDNNHIAGNYTWLSQGTFLAETGELIGAWTNPICINSVRNGRDGKDGRNGQDGTDIEFIYKLAHSENEGRQFPTPESENIDDYVPGPNPNTRGYWCDHPMGIDGEEYLVEMICTREKNKETGDWGPFIGPVVWSSWGEDGTDGDGVEYIFRIATNDEVTQDSNGKYHLNDLGTWPPTCGDGCSNAFYTIASGHGYTRDQLTDMYQNDEWVPGDDASNIGWDRNWTDDPRDVDVNEPFEFVSIRKYNGSTGTWSWFSEPVLWNKYYISSAPIFTSIAFCRSTKNLGSMSLSGGTVINPLPDDQTVDGELIHWYDSIPGAEEYPNSTRAVAPIWMTSSKFGSVDPTVVITANWSSPMLLADNKYFNVEYSNSNINPSAPGFRLPKFDETIGGIKPFIDLTNPEGVNESAWRQYCTQHSLGTWSDNVSNPKWMATCTFNEGVWSEWTITQIKGEDGENGRGIVSVAYYYMWSNDGVNHPTASDPSWSSTIPSNPNNLKYLWKKTVTTYSSGTTTETTYEVISEVGAPGPIGPKMRMRNWKTNYPNPDTDGQTGWLNGDGANDAFYDIAIWPNVQGGIDTNVADAADRLYRCVRSITYAEIATLVSQYGATNVHPGTGGHLENYFTQAVGWDFVATNLLLANKIQANQIDVNGLSAKTIVTDVTDGSYASIAGNTIELKKDGTTKCKISGNPIEVSASNWVEKVWDTPLGYRFAGNSFNQTYNKTINLGSFTIDESSQHQIDTIYSSVAQQINLEFIGTWKQNIGPNTTGDVGVYVTSRLIARNQVTQRDTVWYQAGYGQNVWLFTSPQATDPGNIYQSGDDKPDWNFTIDTSDPENFGIGVYDLILDITIVDTRLSEYFENMELYLSQYQSGTNTWIGVHDPIVRHTAVSSEIQYTDIGTDGFAHVLDGNNKFYIQKKSGDNYLTLEFLSNGLYGLKIDGTGIYKTSDGGTTWTSL